MKKKPAVPDFIKQERSKGVSDEEIQRKLLEAGWHMDIIHSALNGKKDSAPPVVSGTADYKKNAGNTVKSPVFITIAVVLLLVLLAIFI